MTTAGIITKFCKGCEKELPLTDFHPRTRYRDILVPTESKHVLTECKICMRGRTKTQVHLSPHETRTASENLFMEYLASKGIPALPGKALKDVWVDVVAFGHVWIEIKYSTLVHSHNAKRFKFGFTPTQQKRGPQGHIIALICDWEDHQTFHFFPHDFKAFYMPSGKRKTGFDFVPGQLAPSKHRGRVIMTQPMMDEARGKYGLIHFYLKRINEALLRGERPEYGKPFARDNKSVVLKQDAAA